MKYFRGLYGHLIDIVIFSLTILFVWDVGAHGVLPNQVPLIGPLVALALGVLFYFVHLMIQIYQTRYFKYQIDKTHAKTHATESAKADADLRYRIIKDLEKASDKGLEKSE